MFLEEALEIAGHGKISRLALITNGFLMQYATMECLSMGYILNKAECALSLTNKERELVAMATFMGVVSTAVFWGGLCDAYGRRGAMLLPTMLAVVFSLGSSLTQDFVGMFVLRILTGVMISASCATAPVYLAELTSPSRRPVAIGWCASFVAQAYIWMSVNATIFLPRQFDIVITKKFHIVPWRVFMWVNNFWGVAASVGMTILPESPAYTLATEGSPAAKAILAKMFALNLEKVADEYPVQEIHVYHKFEPNLVFAIFHLRPMLRPPLLRCSIVTHVCIFFVFMQSQAFYVWMPRILHELMVKGHYFDTKNICTIMSRHYNETPDACVPRSLNAWVYPVMIVAGLLTLMCFPGITEGRLRYGNKKMYSIVMATCGGLLMAASVVPFIPLAIILYLFGITSITASTVMVPSVLDVFPIRLRALAMSTMFMTGRLGAAFGSAMLEYGFHNSCVPIVAFITVITAASGIVMYQWPNDNSQVRREMIERDFNY